MNIKKSILTVCMAITLLVYCIPVRVVAAESEVEFTTTIFNFNDDTTQGFGINGGSPITAVALSNDTKALKISGLSASNDISEGNYWANVRISADSSGIHKDIKGAKKLIMDVITTAPASAPASVSIAAIPQSTTHGWANPQKAVQVVPADFELQGDGSYKAVLTISAEDSPNLEAIASDADDSILTNIILFVGSTTDSISLDNISVSGIHTILVDDIQPTVGGSGIITASNATGNSVDLVWTTGSDDVTSAENLQYKIVYSTSNNIDTVSNAEANGTVAQDFTANIISKSVTGLTAGKTYYFNVIVKDETENKNLYTTATIAISNIDVVTTPAAVTIKGTQKVGNTLSAELIDENQSVTTTSAAVTYNWYRLNSLNSEFNNVIGTGTTYTLISSDLDKYIGLEAIYDGKTFTDKTGIITASSSGSSSSSSNSHQNSTTSTSDQTITADNNNQATLADGWKENSQDWKYIKNGQSVTGWNQIDGSWYLMDSLGNMQVGWRQTNGAWYLLKDNGAMETGWKLSNSTWYFLKDNGAMAKGWVESNGVWYLLKDNGAMAVGWQESNGEWYSMASNTVIEGYVLDDSGSWIG